MDKKFLIFGVIAFLSIAIVTAGVLTNWGQSTDTFESTNVYEYTGEDDSFGNQWACESFKGSGFTLENVADFPFRIGLIDNSPSGITTTYSSNLELTKKNVDFEQDIWTIPEEAEKVQVEYSLSGDSFSAEVVNNAKEGYELIYYKDNSDRFSNPAEVIKIGDVLGDLPYETDGNTDEYDYCETGEYLTCHGAKIWYVPSNAINQDNTLDWSRASEFFFESELIQYNSDGEYVIYPSHTLYGDKWYELDCLLEEGEYSVEVSVNPLGQA